MIGKLAPDQFFAEMLGSGIAVVQGPLPRRPNRARPNLAPSQILRQPRRGPDLPRKIPRRAVAIYRSVDKFIQPRQRRRLTHPLMRQTYSSPAPHRSSHLPIRQIVRGRPNVRRAHLGHRSHWRSKAAGRYSLPERRIDFVIAALPGRYLPRLDQQSSGKTFRDQPLRFQCRLHSLIARHRLRIIHPLPHHADSTGFSNQILQYLQRIAAPQDQTLTDHGKALRKALQPQPQPPLRRSPQGLRLRIQNEHRQQRPLGCHCRGQHRMIRQPQIPPKP